MRRPVFLSIFPGTNYSSPETNFFCWYHSSFWLPIVHLNFIRAQPAQLELYLDFLEEIAAWLHARGIAQWRPGDFRRATDYYRQAVAGGEVWLAYAETELVGTLRILPADPIVWPEVKVDDAVYVNTLAVRRDWAHAGVGTALLATQGRALNLLVLGEREAFHLGLSTERTRVVVIVMATLVAGASVAVAGIISFVGLVVPHFLRLTIGPDHRSLLPASALGGAVLLLIADLVARTIAIPAELPLGVVTALIGGPYFLYLLRRTRREQGGWG